MPSTPVPKATDRQDKLATKPEIVATARADRASAKPAPDRRAGAPQGQAISDAIAGGSTPAATAAPRAAEVERVDVPDDQPVVGKWARRARMGLLFAFCSAFAATGWARYGDMAIALAVSWAPSHLLMASPPQRQPGMAEQRGSPVVEAAAADPAATQPEFSAQSAASVAPSPEPAQLLQSMSQQIDQLKASIEELKTGQEQISRDVSETRIALAKTSEIKTSEMKTSEIKTSEQNLSPMMLARPLDSAATPARKPRPALAPAQTAAAAPMQLRPPASARTAAQRAGDPVLRPPMPMRSSTALP
jgi:hypothetical protein